MRLPRLSRPWSTIVQTILVAATSFGIAAALVSRSQAQSQRVDTARYQRLDSLRQPGEQMLLIYVGSARCQWCKHPDLPQYVRTVKDSLALEAARHGLQLVTVGVAVDVLKEEGLAHLQNIADFDQVSAGNSWLNMTVVDLVWERYGAPASTPQLLVLRRHTERQAGASMAVTYNVVDEALLARKVGIVSIADWTSRGVPLTRSITER